MFIKIIIHSTAAAFELLTVILPIVGINFFHLDKENLISRSRLIINFNRIQNLMMVISLVTGALLWGTLSFNWWIAMVLGLYLFFGAGIGLMNRALKRLISNVENHETDQANIRGFILWSIVTSASIIGILILKIM